MRERRTTNRRQADRLLKHRFALSVITAAVVIVGGLSTMKACTSDGPTAPSPVVVPAPRPGPAPSAGTPQAVAPEDGANFEKLVSVNCQGTDCTFTNLTDAAKPVDAVCTTIGLHNDWGSWNGVVPGSGAVNVSVYDICDPVKIGIDLCKGGEQAVQVDFRYGKTSIHIGQWGLGGQKLVYAPNEEYCECEPGKWEIVEKGDPVEGDVVECPIRARTKEESCFECFEITTKVIESNGCEQRERTISDIDRRQIECPCEPEWTPGEPEITFEPAGDCGEYDDRDGCEQPGVYTKTVIYANQCNDKTRREVTEERGFQACDCPAPGLCYYRVSCGDQEGFTASKKKECKEKDQQDICEAAVGLAGDSGIWRNFGEQNLLNHCQFNEPGYVNNDFQLSPGQSDPDCLNKRDD